MLRPASRQLPRSHVTWPGAALARLEPRKKDVVPEILPPEMEIARVVRTVLVADVVESVRLMQEDESGTVQRWRAFVDHVVHRLLPGQDGRLVKSLGDGLMLEFTHPSTAVNVAFAMQDAMAQANRDVERSRRLHLRIGINVSQLIADEHDVYGHGVNLAARLMTLAGPDEIVVSADVRDQLTPALDRRHRGPWRMLRQACPAADSRVPGRRAR
jgi:class 3 adenylate cyclase